MERADHGLREPAVSGLAGTAISDVICKEELASAVALAAYDILDTPREAAFDEIVQLAADALCAPFAQISFLDGHRQWFKAEIGIGQSETSLASSISAHVAWRHEVVVVTDLAIDERFASHPLVSSGPRLRFYAGAPLRTPDGTAIGVIGVLDTEPRGAGIDARQARMLNTLAAQVMARLELRRERSELRKLNAALRESEEHYWYTIELSPQMPWTADANGNVLTPHRRWQEISGLGQEALLGKGWLQAVHPDDLADVKEAARQTYGGVTKAYDVKYRYRMSDNSYRWMRARAAPRCNAERQIIRWYGTTEDIHDQELAQIALRESEEHYRYSVELNPQIPWTAEPDGRLAEVSPRWQELTGQSSSKFRGAAVAEAFHPADVAEARKIWREAVRTGQPYDVEYRLLLRNGSYRWFRSRAAARRASDGTIERWYGTLEDIHDRKLAEQALRESEERFRLAARAAGLGIWDYDALSGTRTWSDELKLILGLPLDHPADIEACCALVHPDDQHVFRSLYEAADERDPRQRFEATLRIRRADNQSERWVRTGGWATVAEGGQVTRLIITIRDITDERSAEERIRWTASHDTLTRLPTRALFQEELDEALRRAAAKQHKVGLLALDIDHFKQINDSLGHDAGDALLCEFADRLRAIAHGEDVVARRGGDEFAIILPQLQHEDELTSSVDSILERLRAPFIYEGHVLDCKASIGASIYPDDACAADEILKNADIALYVAKAAGRGRMMLFKPEMRTGMQNRASMLTIAREAVERNRISAFYQPKVELSTGRLHGFEALLRWRHPRAGIQLPGTISAAFEDFDVATLLSDRIFDLTIADMRRWLDDGVDFGHVAVNASAAEFRRDDLAERILERLGAAGVPTSCFELEVTETVFLGRGAGYVDRALNLLSREGVRIALDDFGTGYASLSHLKQFPVHTIKIDRSFVRDIQNYADDAPIIKAVLNLGQSLGIKIVAEGIEAPVQAAYLAKQGCDYGQGYLFGKPLPAGRIPLLISQWCPNRRWKRSR